MKLLLSAIFLAGIVSCSSHQTPSKTHEAFYPATLKQAVENPLRSPENRARDVYRHPLKTLSFFGLKPSMKVVEIWPSSGWYTEILAPYLASQGRYIIADPASDPNGYTSKRKQWLAKYPAYGEKASMATFQPGQTADIVPAGSVDMVLTFRNVHNWLPVAHQEAAFKSFFKALKPGGTLGVVEHRANMKKKFDPKSGYVPQSEVIRLATQAGFKLVAKSEMNANPKDKADYPDGVWTLPPRLKLGEKDQAKYLKIGESDRMTLKFIKP